jgi:hypothetical protein
VQQGSSHKIFLIAVHHHFDLLSTPFDFCFAFDGARYCLMLLRRPGRTQIQRQYRAHRKRKALVAEAQMEREKELRAKLEEEERIARMKARRAKAKSVEGKAAKLVKGLGEKFMVKKDQSVPLKDKIADAKKSFGDMTFVSGSRWTGRTHPEEKKERDMMLDNAILNNHTRTSIMTGIVDVKLTYGAQEKRELLSLRRGIVTALAAPFENVVLPCPPPVFYTFFFFFTQKWPKRKMHAKR